MITNILLVCICGSIFAIAIVLARIADMLDEIKKGGNV